ncbi:MAG: hypothetical protein WA902_24260, partial [Thermosynechococcaceae cyanobacterium]
MGLGLVMLMLGVTTIMVAQNGQTRAWQRKEVGTSRAITEGGVARTLAQLTHVNNSVLLSRNYDPINPQTGTTYFGPDDSLNSGDEEGAAVDEWTNCLSNPSTCSSGTLGSPNLSLNGTIGSDGQYELKAYRYNDIQKTGTFLIKGQQGSSTFSVAVTVSIDVTSMGSPPGMWISWNPKSSASGSVQLQTDIQDSTNTSDIDANRVDKLKAYQVAPSGAASASYDATPGVPFPNLPSTGQNPPTTGMTGSYNIAPIGGPTILPVSGEIADADGVLKYHIGESGGKSINLTGGENITVGTGSETVELYLDGGIDLSGGSAITIAPGSKLIIYTHGKVTLTGKSTINPLSNSGNLEDAQLYVYTNDEVALTGGSGMKLFLFAPNSEVRLSASSFQGTLWSKSWSGSGKTFLQ